MNIFFYRYGCICEPDITESFQKIGLNVIEETKEITDKGLNNSQRIQLVENALKTHRPIFVFSINFFPAIAEICHIYKTPYLCWTVDSPVPELFSESIRRDTNRIFLFDRAQYNLFAPYNPANIFHLPLASASERFDKVIAGITAQDRRTFAKDIAFVGSLYNEKNPLSGLVGLSDFTRGFLSGLEESALKVYGYNFVEAALPEKIVQEIKSLSQSFYDPGKAIAPSDSYVIAHCFVGMEIAMKERIQTLQALANHFSVDLFTLSDTTPLAEAATSGNLHLHGGVASLTEMPKIFHLSKINLNMTIKPIQEGLPLRIFDIMGCGGFCMTNYQAELPDYFEIGQDLEAYASLDELIDKCAYYLSHEDERQRIAQNGYKKVCEGHTYLHRINEMLKKVVG